MPPTLSDRLDHILDAIDNIQQLLAGRTRTTFANDLILRLAVERSFEIVSEASRRLPNDVKERQPDIDWLGMADLGNRLRHTLSPYRCRPAVGHCRARFAPAEGFR